MEVLVDPERASEGPASSVALRETFHVAIPGQRFALTLSVTNRSPVQLAIGEAGITRTQGWEVTAAALAGDLPVHNATWRVQFEEGPDNANTRAPTGHVQTHGATTSTRSTNHNSSICLSRRRKSSAYSVMKSKACNSCSLVPCRPSILIARGASSAAC